ncbi:type II secretion system F family protein [Paenibacillus sp. UMB4589-SE434]|uniref:type II secretion system F family protein n=1 Tax=Paenibacillus sp. UMB4589-SE434 TaxID=3046314 RepID=UPI00254DB94B|nr:type II secretion system F family protein [Paenibacillus sp. UMB4589-SE434]MDK8181844.1 type II secretion system F family protein [Paenibacillus sp. UMB4589-SE434]
MMLAGAGIFVLLILGLKLMAGKQYDEFVKENGQGFQLNAFAPSSLALIDRLRIVERSSRFYLHIHQKIVQLYGSRKGISHTRMFLAQMVSFVLLLLVISFVLPAVAEGDTTYLFIGLLLTVLVPFSMVKDLDKKIQKRKQAITLELPEFLSRITLLVNAGETVQKAIIRCVEQKKHMHDHPLYAELQQVSSEVSNNYSFPQAMEDFSKRCAMQEISIFVTTVLMNYRRGGEEFVASLQGLSQDLWAKRKAVTKTLGEEASSKMVFPMMIIFLVVMIIVGAPAMMMMK